MIPATATFCPRCGMTLGGGRERLVFTPVAPAGDAAARAWRVRVGLAVLLIVAGILFLGLLLVPFRMTVRNTSPLRQIPLPSVPASIGPVRMQQMAITNPRTQWQPRFYRMAEIDEPALPGGRVVVPLREPFDAYHVGGGGRYHLFHLPRAGVIAILDVSAAAVVKEIAIAPGEVRFAAGLKYFLVLDATQGKLERWSFKTFTRDRTAQLPIDAPLRELVMAPADDTAYLTFDDATYTYDVKAMQPAAEPEALPGLGRALPGLKLSFDGQLGTVGPKNLMLTYGRRIEVGTTDQSATPGTSYQPSADGTLVFVGNQPYTREGKKLDAKFADGICAPSVDARFFWVIGRGQASLYTTSDRQLVYTLRGLEEAVSPSTFCHLPQAKVILTAAPSQVVILRFDLMEELARTGEPYLFVQSMPLERASRGSLYTYWLDARSKAGGVKYRLQSGPKGMSVNPSSGVVLWTPPEDMDPERITVRIAVKDDSGREILHRFEVEVTE